MGQEGKWFKVKNNKFWILEQRIEEEETKEKGKPKKEEYKVNAWIFDNERDAILKLKELIAQEKIELDKLDEVVEKIGEKYNLQEVEIARDKYNMRSISWLKVALLGFAEAEK